LTGKQVQGSAGIEIPKKMHSPLLDARKLNEWESLFICTMESNAKNKMNGDVKSLNPLTKLWRIIDGSTMLRHGLLEYLKLAEIAVVLILGSVEEGQTTQSTADSPVDGSQHARPNLL
jgi:hypothetical protein